MQTLMRTIRPTFHYSVHLKNSQKLDTDLCEHVAVLSHAGEKLLKNQLQTCLRLVYVTEFLWSHVCTDNASFKCTSLVTTNNKEEMETLHQDREVYSTEASVWSKHYRYSSVCTGSQRCLGRVGSGRVGLFQYSTVLSG